MFKLAGALVGALVAITMIAVAAGAMIGSNDEAGARTSAHAVGSASGYAAPISTGGSTTGALLAPVAGAPAPTPAPDAVATPAPEAAAPTPDAAAASAIELATHAISTVPMTGGDVAGPMLPAESVDAVTTMSPTTTPPTTTSPLPPAPPPLTVIGFSPQSGLVGTVISITVANLPEGPLDVQLDNAPLPITAVTRDGTGATITVTTLGYHTSGTILVAVGSAVAFAPGTFTVPPARVTAMSQTSGVAGTTVTLELSGFPAGEVAVTQAGSPVEVLSVETAGGLPVRVTVRTNRWAPTGSFEVRVGHVVAQSPTFEVLPTS